MSNNCKIHILSKCMWNIYQNKPDKLWKWCLWGPGLSGQPYPSTWFQQFPYSDAPRPWCLQNSPPLPFLSLLWFMKTNSQLALSVSFSLQFSPLSTLLILAYLCLTVNGKTYWEHSQLTHNLHVICTIYCILTIK